MRALTDMTHRHTRPWGAAPRPSAWSCHPWTADGHGSSGAREAVPTPASASCRADRGDRPARGQGAEPGSRPGQDRPTGRRGRADRRHPQHRRTGTANRRSLITLRPTPASSTSDATPCRRPCSHIGGGPYWATSFRPVQCHGPHTRRRLRQGSVRSALQVPRGMKATSPHPCGHGLIRAAKAGIAAALCNATTRLR